MPLSMLVLFPAAPAVTAGAPESGSEALGAQPDDLDPGVVEQIAALTADKAARTPAQAKIDSNLLYEIKRDRNDPLFDVVPDLRTDVILDRDELVLVDIDATVDDLLLDRIERLGGVVVNSHPRYRAVRARVPLDAIEVLAGSARVSHIRTADQAMTSKVNTSEGDVAHRAASARSTFGVTGAGVGACVLSDSIDALATLQASGDLPAVSVLPGQSGNPGTSEGTAMLEIVYDLAPGADLGFASAFNGQAQFAQNILDLRTAGCDVIVDDVAYFAEPVFQDGIIADAVDTVVADGALYFSSAGNSGNLDDGTSGVWEGDFDAVAVPPAALAGAGAIHDFGDGTGLNTITGNTSVITLQWADPQGASGNDYDLFALDATGSTVLACGCDIQDGNDNPFEALGASGDITGVKLAVALSSGSPRFLHLNTNRGRLAQATAGQTSGHSAAEGAYSVAAVDQADAGGGAFTGGPANPVETFSSDGPRRVFFDAAGVPYTPGDFSSGGGVVRQKPDITAADGVATATPGFAPFFGTSAAAPHAAAIAALLLDEKPSLTDAEVDALFAATALDIEAPGTDRDSGYGIIDAFALVDAAQTPTAPSAPSGVVGAAGDGEVSVSWVAPVSDGGSPITGYTVTAAPGGATCSTMGATSCTVVGLTNGTPYTFTVTATNAVGTGPASAPSASATPMAAVADLVTVEPARLLDTRPSGSTVDGQFLGAGKLVGGQFTKVKIAGRGGVAADAVGVELNITAIQNEGRGFATLYPCTATPPTASSLNYTPGVNIANATTVALNANGEVCVFSNVTAHYALDVLAYVPAGSDLVTVEPSRLLDTRPTGSTVDGQFLGAGKLVGGQFTKVKIAGRGGVAADAVGVELNITAIQNEGRGFATLYPCTATPPTASSLNYTPGVNIANATTVALNANGEVCVFSNVTAHYALDVLAYVPAGSDLVTVEPSRLLDTRPTGSTVDGQFLGAGKLVGGQFTKVKIAGRGGVAADAVGVELNITAIQNEGRGFATLYPCTATPPTASSLNYTPGVNIANATTVALNANGEVCVFSNVTAHYALDVLAYVAA